MRIEPEGSGLEQPIKAEVHLVRHVGKGRILKSLGKLEGAVLREIEDLLRELFGLWADKLLYPPTAPSSRGPWAGRRR